MKFLFGSFLALLVSVGFFAVEVVGQVTGVVAIKAGHLLDVTTGRTLDHQLVLVENETIKSIAAETDGAIPPGARVIDLSQQWVLPGLIDCHTHITFQMDNYYADTFRRSPINDAVETHVFARKTLEAGFTTCRDVGSREFIDVALKRAIAAGKG